MGRRVIAPPSPWVYGRGILYALDVTGEISPVTPRCRARLAEAGTADTGALAAAMCLPAPEVADRLGTRRCFAAWAGGQIAAYGWVSRTRECIGEQEREILLQPRDAYIWDCATIAEYRRNGLYGALLSHMAAALGAEGICRLWIGTSLDNTASLRGFARAGFRPVLTLVYCRCLSLRCVWTKGHPASPPSLVDAARAAVLTDRERAAGALSIAWSPAEAEPCEQAETRLRTV